MLAGKYLDGLNLQLQRRVLVYHDHGMWVQLKGGQSPHMVHSPLNALLQRQCFVRPGNNNHHLPRLQHCLHAHRQCHLRHLFQIIVEESAIRNYRIISQGLDSRSRGEGGPGLVERDVAVWADAPEEEVDAAVCFDCGFVADAFGFEVGRVAV